MVQDAKEPQKRAFETRGTSERRIPSAVGDRDWLILVSRLVALSDAARGRAERLAERLTRQQELSAALAAAATPLDVANAVFERLLGHVGAFAANLSWTRDQAMLEPIHSVGYSPDRAAERFSVDALLPNAIAFRTNSTVVVGNLEEAAAYGDLAARLRAEGSSAYVALPLVARGVPLGVLGLSWAHPHRIGEEERAFLEGIAPVVAQAVERARLLEDERRTRAATDSTLDGVVFFRAERDAAGAIVDFVAEWTNGRGSVVRELTGSPTLVGLRLSALSAASRERIETYARVVETGERIDIHNVRFEWETEGSSRFVEYDLRVARSGDGVVIAWRDVTLRGASERAVRDKQAIVDLLARAVPQIIWITEAPNVVFLNDRWADYTGTPVAETLARGWEGLTAPIHPDDLPAVAQSWAAARAGGETWQLEYRMRRHDGVYRWHLGRAVPQTDGGVLVRWVGTATDIEDLRRAEAEKAEEDAFRERLFGIAGHDLRNPLNAIVMAGALLEGRDELSVGSRKLVGRIRRSADRMTRLIGQLLDLSRIRSGAGLALVRGRVDLGELAREVADEARAGTPDALIAVRVLGDSVGEWDRDRLAQVVANLVSNAIQHGRRGAPVGITVDGEHDPRAVRVEVVNEGDPIPEAERATLFEPWKRGASTRDRRTGAGLGLYIVHGVVTAHGGTVGVESDLLGTRVCLALPR